VARQKKKVAKPEYEPERRLVGYARVSTDDQDLAMQKEALIKYGVKPIHIYEEKKSGKTMKRKELEKALKSLREFDTLVVWKLDRFSRDGEDILTAIRKLHERGVKFVSITEGFDATTPHGMFMLQMLAAVAQMERALTAERTRAGIAVRKAAGVHFGRSHLIRDNKARMAFLRKKDKAGKLRAWPDDYVEDNRYVCIYPGGQKALLAKLLEIDTTKDQHIKNLETVRRWFRGGCPDLPPLPSDDDE